MKTNSNRKSMKMEADELTEKIKACVKEALEEQAEAKADGEEGIEEPAAEVNTGDISALIEQAMDVVAEKRKSRKDAGEDVGEVTADDILEAVGEIVEATAAKADEGDPEEKEDDETIEGKSFTLPARQTKAKAAKASRAPVQRKYAGIYMSGASGKKTEKKAVPPSMRSASMTTATWLGSSRPCLPPTPQRAAISSPRFTWTRSLSCCTPRPSSSSWALRRCPWQTAT